MPKPRLISFNLCPFVQRSVITLEEKGVEYDIEYIDLSDKPQWFLELSPLGKVPVLQVGKTVLFESAVINEYLDDVNPPSMHPKDPLERAQNRALIEFISALIVDQFLLQTTTDEAGAKNALTAAKSKLRRLEDLVTGPLYAGKEFTLVDAAAAPALVRLQWMNKKLPTLGIFEGTPKVRAWADVLAARPSVVRSTVPSVESLFWEYTRGGGTPTREVPPSWLAGELK